MTSNSYWLVVHSVVKTSQYTTLLSGDFVGLLKWLAVRTGRAYGLIKWCTVQKSYFRMVGTFINFTSRPNFIELLSRKILLNEFIY